MVLYIFALPLVGVMLVSRNSTPPTVCALARVQWMNFILKANRAKGFQVQKYIDVESKVYFSSVMKCIDLCVLITCNNMMI